MFRLHLEQITRYHAHPWGPPVVICELLQKVLDLMWKHHIHAANWFVCGFAQICGSWPACTRHLWPFGGILRCFDPLGTNIRVCQNMLVLGGTAMETLQTHSNVPCHVLLFGTRAPFLSAVCVPFFWVVPIASFWLQKKSPKWPYLGHWAKLSLLPTNTTPRSLQASMNGFLAFVYP